MRKVFDVRAFQAGYFLLAALSFNSLTAGRRFMSLYGRDQPVSGQLCGELTVEPVLWNCR